MLGGVMKKSWILFVFVLSCQFIIAQTQVGNDIDGEAIYDQSGYSVSLSSNGSRVAIGAYCNDSNAGHVRIYDLVGDSWVQVGSDIDGEEDGDGSGYSVSLSSDGSRVAIGAPYNDGTAAAAGHVRIYNWNGSSWVQVGSDIDGEADDNWSGYSVSLSSDGSRVAIGANRNDGDGTLAGHVRVYHWDGSSWSQVGSDIDGEANGDQSGWSVSLSSDGSRVAIGAIYNDGTASSAGHVRVYDWDSSSWSQVGSDIDGEAGDDQSGYFVSLSSDGSSVAIGAPYNDGNGTSAGHVRVYDWDGSSWVQVGSDIDGEAASDESGRSVSLSSDGSRVAIGANGNDGTASNAGHVRVYDLDGDSWVQVGSDIDGEAAEDRSGHSVSLSSNGNGVAIGANGNDENGSYAGHVRVYLNYGETALPVTLSSFTAIYSNESALLNWTTQSETDNLGFNIYRSDNENGFEADECLSINTELIPGMGTTFTPTDYSFTDEYMVLEGHTYFYWLESVSTSNELELFGPISIEIPIAGQLPIMTILSANYPNPFNPETTISFNIKENEIGTLEIYNLRGQRILKERFEAGTYQYQWNAEGLASGIYFYKLSSPTTNISRKMILMK
jgi:Secretion system C-terminal sorting domain